MFACVTILLLIVGMLWTGETPKAESLKETMESYFNALQGFLLCCHGSTVGAGPTLSSIIHVSVKHIVDSSFRLLQGSVSLYGNKLKVLYFSLIIQQSFMILNSLCQSVV